MDIRFSRTLNSCKLPQIRYASPERLFERLTDLRFLSIDFLNTFLLTYRVFTDSITVIEALKRVHYTPEMQLNAMSSSSLHDSSGSLDGETGLPKAGHEGAPPPGAGHHLHPSGPSPHHGNLLNISTAGQSTLPQAGVAAANDLLSTTIEYDYGRRVSTSSVLSDIAELGGSGRDNLHRESVVEPIVQQQQQAAIAQQNQVFSASSPVIRNSQHWRLSYRKCKFVLFSLLTILTNICLFNIVVEEEQARDRYLKRMNNRQQHGSISSTTSSQQSTQHQQQEAAANALFTLPSGEPLLAPAITDPIAVPVPPPPSPEVPGYYQKEMAKRGGGSDFVSVQCAFYNFCFY